MVEIWGKSDCIYCEKIKQFCETMELNYNYKTLNIDYSREEFLEMFPGVRTVPQVKVNGTFVGGYSEFISYVEETSYNGTGWAL